MNEEKSSHFVQDHHFSGVRIGLRSKDLPFPGKDRPFEFGVTSLQDNVPVSLCAWSCLRFDDRNSSSSLGQVPPASPPTIPTMVLESFQGIARQEAPSARHCEEVSVVVA